MAFIKSDREQTGFTTVKKLVKRLHAFNILLDKTVLNFLLVSLYEKKNSDDKINFEQEIDANALLSFAKLQSLIQIYYRCPVTPKGYTNNSNNMRQLITMPGYEDDIQLLHNNAARHTLDSDFWDSHEHNRSKSQHYSLQPERNSGELSTGGPQTNPVTQHATMTNTLGKGAVSRSGLQTQ